MTKKHKLYNIWSQVPVDYYQQGTKKNILQKIWHQHKINTAKKIINPLRFKNCLDVGCASGYMISEIAKAYPKALCFGIDVYDRAILHAKKLYPNITFKVAVADKIPFSKDYFDLIICYETIEHVEHPLEVLQKIKRVLNKNGTLILAMDSGNLLFKTIWFVWEKTLGKVWQGAHLNAFHHRQLERLVQTSGFKIINKRFSHFGLEIIFILKK